MVRPDVRCFSRPVLLLRVYSCDQDVAAHCSVRHLPGEFRRPSVITGPNRCRRWRDDCDSHVLLPTYVSQGAADNSDSTQHSCCPLPLPLMRSFIIHAPTVCIHCVVHIILVAYMSEYQNDRVDWSHVSRSLPTARGKAIVACPSIRSSLQSFPLCLMNN